MIVTVTLNPAFDHLLFLPEASLNQVNRAKETLRMPGGKGINVASSLAILGNEVIATGFLGGQGSRTFEESLRKIGVTTSFIYIDKEIRTDFYLIEEEKKRQTLVIEEGTSIDLRYLNSFKSNFERLLSSATIIEIGGSLPKGVASNFIKELINSAGKKKVKVILNLQEAILNECLDGANPFIVCPDLRECCKFFGKDLSKSDLRLKAARQLMDKGAEIVILNYSDLVCLVTNRNESWEGEIEASETSIMIGVQDALLAGFIHNYLSTNSLGEALKYGLGTALSTTRNKLNHPNSKKEAEELRLMAKVKKVS